MHIAVCKLLSVDGIYTFEGRDQDGWPHYKLTRPFQYDSGPKQEQFIKQKIVEYFNSLEKEYKTFSL